MPLCRKMAYSSGDTGPGIRRQKNSLHASQRWPDDYSGHCGCRMAQCVTVRLAGRCQVKLPAYNDKAIHLFVLQHLEIFFLWCVLHTGGVHRIAQKDCVSRRVGLTLNFAEMRAK